MISVQLYALPPRALLPSTPVNRLYFGRGLFKLGTTGVTALLIPQFQISARESAPARRPAGLLGVRAQAGLKISLNHPLGPVKQGARLSVWMNYACFRDDLETLGSKGPRLTG